MMSLNNKSFVSISKIDEMTITLAKAKEKLFEQRDMLEALTREPLPLGHCY
ncbi:MAG: hypothetical protein MZV63_18335 [Marinilabiliales bacterium]|nr:hypothetical protein [Marinilabiliales bacterium]